MSDKPAILKDETFVIEEGWTYRILRGSSILLNKLFFGAAVLWLVWVLLATTGQVESCAPSVATAEVQDGNETVLRDVGTTEHCTPLLTPTSLYLAGMAVVTFTLSILFGLLGLVVGKKIVQATPADQEPGAPKKE